MRTRRSARTPCCCTRSAVKSEIGPRVTIGPFAYLRPGASIAADAHIGTYVELKKSHIGAGAKVPHLTYVGDATIGAGSNIGAGTIFANYDGAHKHHTEVGENAFVGSNTVLVAPVTIGDGAYTAAGSAITEDVPAGDLGIARGRQHNSDGWVLRNRQGTRSAEAATRTRSDESLMILIFGSQPARGRAVPGERHDGAQPEEDDVVRRAGLPRACR